MTTYLELKAQAEALMQKAEEVRKIEIAEVIADIKTKIKKYEITASDLGLSVGSTKGANKKAGPSSPAVVRYRGLNGEEWSGMGRQPGWMKKAIETGKNKEDFAV